MAETFGHIIAVMVTYNSGAELRANITALLPQVEKLIIVDNSTEPDALVLLKSLEQEFSALEVTYNRQNLGLGAAQNTGIRRAAVLGAQWVLLMDDDSLPDSRMVEKLGDIYRAHTQPEKIGLLAARIIDVESGKRYPCLKMYSKWKVSRVDMDAHPYMDDALLAMASGSLIRMDALKKTGLMREDFFVDFIDWEFALRLQAKGYRIVQARDAVLNHRLGAQTNHRLLGRKFVTTNYPPFRRYTTARNRILFWRIFFLRLPIGCFLYQCMSAIYEALVILLFEQRKWSNIKEIIRGTWHGVLRRGLEPNPPSL